MLKAFLTTFSAEGAFGATLKFPLVGLCVVVLRGPLAGPVCGFLGALLITLLIFAAGAVVTGAVAGVAVTAVCAVLGASCGFLLNHLFINDVL